MRTVELLDLSVKDHREFMYDLGMTCKDDFLDDYDNDIILLMNHYGKEIEGGGTKAFLCLDDGQKAGIIWVDIDTKGIGYIHAALMPEYRKGFNALHFLRQFVAFCFEHTDLRKIEAHLPTRNRRAEKLIIRIGFTKEGLRKAATMKNGKPENHVLLAITRDQYEGRLRNVRRKKAVQLNPSTRSA